MTRIVITGHGRHGKDTVSEILRNRYAFTFTSSSAYVARRAVFPTLRERYGYETVEQCYEDRHAHRQEWYDLIVEYNTPDRARLGRELLSEFNIYCGLRSLEELEALRAEQLVDHVVWVDASGRLPLEPASSLTIRAQHADHVVDNNGTLEQLVVEVDDLMRKII
jgi:dephospho-CoA kinase